MSEVKFTKGPWFKIGSFVGTSESWPNILSGCQVRPNGESEANAALIAVAPEMYEMLEDCMCHLFNNCHDDESKDLIKKIIELRKNARGEK